MATKWYQVGPFTTPYFPPNGGTDHTPNTRTANCGQTVSVSGMVTVNSLQESVLYLMVL